MERLVIFGKGGIGKSTTASNMSAAMQMGGRGVLHIGCDPKADSTVQLLHGHMIPAITDQHFDRETVTRGDIITRAPIGVDCVEAGGPGAGLGCGGRAITRMLQIFQWADLLDPARYDCVVFDVLGDLVCGGFASPLKRGVGKKVLIVASEEVMALYAANNIARAVVNYSSNGVVLAGIICNLRNNRTDRTPIENFAKLLNTRIVGYVPRDELIREAEYQRMTVVEYAPEAPISRLYGELAERILAIDPDDCPLPTPMDEKEFYIYTRYKFDGAAAAKELGREAPDSEAPESWRAPDDETDGWSRELMAGVRAVRMGLVQPDEALQRLRAHFPRQAERLKLADLTT